MNDPICLITGATEGVGKATALELARRGFSIVIAARSAPKAEVLVNEIHASMPHANCDYVLADLASLGDVRQLAETFRQRYPKLDALINNAGIFVPRRNETCDGYESMVQVNYLAPFLLTNLLLPELQKSEQGRIINLSSSVYTIGKFDPANFPKGARGRFSVLGTYAATKLFVLMFTEELAHRLAGTSVTANAVHPGVVRTRMMLRAPGLLRLVSYLSLPFSISSSAGARTSVYLASAPELGGVSGKYFVESRSAAVKNKYDTPENRALLWELSLSATQHRAMADARAR